MSNILISPPPTTLLTGLLQLDGGVAISSTPVYVADQTNTDSKLALSTTSVNVNTLTGSALVNIKGTGASSSTSSLIVQNSAGTNVIQALDNTNIYFGKAIKIGSGGTITDTSGYMTMYNGGNTARIGPEYFSTDSSGWSATILNGGPTLSLSYLGYGAIDRNWLVGTSPSNTARLSVKGSGSTSATTTMLLQNSAGTELAKSLDDGTFFIGNSAGGNFRFAQVGNDSYLQKSNYTTGKLIFTGTSVGTMASTIFDTTNFGINTGTTTATANLEVRGAVSSNFVKLVNSADTNQYFSAYLGSAPNLWDIGPVADDNNTIWRLYRNNYIVGRVGGTESFRLVASGLGINMAGATPSATIQAKGSGTTSATTTFLAQNSSATQLMKLTDDGRLVVGSGTVSGNAFVDIAIGSGSTNGLRVKAYSDAGTGYLFSGGTESFADNFKIKMVNGNVTMGTQLNGYTFGLETFNGTALQIFNSGNISIGNTTESAKLFVKGSGTTSATSSFLVQNNSGTQVLKAFDDTSVEIGNQASSTAGKITVTPTDSNYYFAFGWHFFGSKNYYQMNIYGNTDSSVGVAIGKGTTSAVNSSILELSSSTKGFLPPRMTTAQKLLIGTPASGLMVYDTSLNQMSYYNGTTWINF
jgi:hypothetical protein